MRAKFDIMAKFQPTDKMCKNCGAVVLNKHINAKYCSTECKSIWFKAHSPTRAWSHLSRNLTGTHSELCVATDLVFRGYEVFSCIAGVTSFDLVAHKSGRLIRVEVATGIHYSDGTCRESGAIRRKYSHSTLHDVLAVVMKKDVKYFPQGIIN